MLKRVEEIQCWRRAITLNQYPSQYKKGYTNFWPKDWEEYVFKGASTNVRIEDLSTSKTIKIGVGLQRHETKIHQTM